ncbi:MAG: WD40 repeat domain-containing protein, partial [Planctomycetaceae bacterium]|nr:WD40 repeat domain-containing protein [Planctomycetaceae bacterium]
GVFGFPAHTKILCAACVLGRGVVGGGGGMLQAQTELYQYDCGQAHVPVFEAGRSASPDGRTRFVPNPSGGLRSGPGAAVDLPHPAQVSLSRFNGRGDRVVTFAGGIVRVWPASGPATAIELASVPNLAPIRLDISDDGDTVMAVTAGNPKAVVWSVKSRAILFQLPNRIDCGPQIFRDESVDGNVNDAVLSPDGTMVVAGVESSGELIAFEAATGRRLGQGVAFRGFLFGLTLTADSRGAIPLGSDLTSREFELPGIKPLGPVLRQPDWPKRFLAVSRSGRQLATMTRSDPRLRIWDLKTGDVLTSISPGFPVDPPGWFNSDATAIQFQSNGAYRRLRLPVYAGARDAVPLAVRVLTGRYLDETGGIADIPQDEYRNDPAAYRDAWLKWRGAP